MKSAFEADYGRLNTAQKHAVDTIEGPVLVVAGPGTGKTQILALRIANIILKTDTQAEQILALTFTDSGQKAMRERLKRYLGKEAYRVPVFTFHSFASAIIQQHREVFPRITSGRLLSDIEKISLIKNILEAGDYRRLKPIGKPELFIQDILSIISNLKQEYITPEHMVDVLRDQEDDLQHTQKLHEKGAYKGKVRGEYTEKQKQLEKNTELYDVYLKYEALLKERSLYDFNDLLLSVVEALRVDEDFRLELQEQYQYVLADEHQDVNGTQNQLLELLMSFHDNPNIFAVGDEKQAIYRFQGASLENFLRFEEVFPSATRIELTENYRSTQAILDTAQALVAVEGGPLATLRVPLNASTKDTGIIEQIHFSEEAVEESAVVARVKAALLKGVPPEEIAIIVKTNSEVERVAKMLRKAGVLTEASADSDILESPLTRAILNLLRFVLDSQNESLLAEVIQQPFWGIDPVDSFKLLSARSYEHTLVELVFKDRLRATLNLSEEHSLGRIVELVDATRTAALTKTPAEILAMLLEQSGLLDYVLKNDPLEGVRIVRRLYDEFEIISTTNETLTMAEAVAEFTLLSDYKIALNAPYVNTSDKAVQVMTAHKSKGLEFHTVLLPFLKDKSWGGKVIRRMFKIPLRLHSDAVDEHKLDDEIRLLYVAMTRAKRELYVSYSDTTIDGREALSTRLLADIDPLLLPHKDEQEYVDTFNPVDHLKPIKSLIGRNEFFLERFAKKGFSATSYNNFVESPWLYFYRNILQIPEVPTLSLRYGTVVHAVLDILQKKQQQTGIWPQFSELEKELTKKMARLPISKEMYTRLHQQALEELAVSYGVLSTFPPKETRSEVSVSTSLETNDKIFPEVILKGNLDRVEYRDGKAVRVVDFKTGKPKSRNEIMGETKNSNGNYYRQLVFYALLLNLYEDYECEREGVLFFVQPNKKGEIRQESFLISVDEANVLKDDLLKAAKSISSGEALDVAPPDDFVYNHLVDFWREK